MNNENQLLKILREKVGHEYHPAILLAEVATDENQDIKLRVDCSKTLLPYVETSLKAVEVRGHVDHTIGLLRVNLFGEDDQNQIEEDRKIDGVNDDDDIIDI